MRIVNDLGLPQAFINAVSGKDPNYKPDPTRIGVTALIDSPMVRRLYIEHYDELVVLASDYLSSFLGICLHEKLQRHAPEGYAAEKKYEFKIGDLTLVGIADLVNGGIEDYKLMSAWSWVFDKEKHFEQQLNILNWMRVKNGEKPAEYLRIHCFIKDWTRYQTKNPDYPQQKYFSYDLKIWPLETTEQFINDRLKLHLDKNYICTEEDRWIRNESWAVMKQGRKSAVRCLETAEFALNYIQNKGLMDEYTKGTVTIVERKSEAKRCSEYCKCKSVCKFGVNGEVK